MDKKNLIYVGVGILLLLVIYNSTKKMELKEVTAEPDNKNFDNSVLPPIIQPPLRINDGEPIPTPVKKEFTLNLIGAYPRFDTA
jgi:hypothetical protein